MMDRCRHPSHVRFARYGGRGIKVCERWESFENFLADMGNRPHGATLDRINTDGDYEPGNCRWATRVEQARNLNRNHRLTLNGESLPLSAWAERLGMCAATIRYRVEEGWSDEAALTTPLLRRRRVA
jgi:hypothetical protein